MRNRAVLEVTRLEDRRVMSTYTPFAPVGYSAWSATYAPWSAAYTSLPSYLSPSPVSNFNTGPATSVTAPAPIYRPTGSFITILPTTISSVPTVTSSYVPTITGTVTLNGAIWL